MKIRTLINPSLLAAGLLLGATPGVQADSGHISVILHDNDNTYDFGYRYGDYGYCCGGHRHGYYDYGHPYGHHHGHHKRHWKKKHWHRGHGHHKRHGHHYSRHDGHRGAHGKGRHGKHRNDGHHRQHRRHDDGHGKRGHRS